MQISELGYLLIGAADVSAWREFALDVIGAMVTDGPDGSLYVKIDPRLMRLAIVPGHSDGLLCAGWLVSGPTAFGEARSQIESLGLPIEPSSQSGLELRCVQDYFGFKDPAGHRHEIAWGPVSDFAPFVSPIGVSRFVTEGLGLGHVVLTALNSFDATVEFWTTVGGMALSDILHVSVPNSAKPARVHFLHCKNPRQHSLAFGELPIPGGCIHIMLEVGTIDDVGRCLDRVAARGAKLTATLGRHVNDEMVSFYVATPGGFSLEYGVGGKVVDWAEHLPFETTRGSHWGHVWS